MVVYYGMSRGCAWLWIAWCLCPGGPLRAATSPIPSVCAALLPQMRRSHIADVALADFTGTKIQTYFCTTTAQPLSSQAVFEAASLSKPVFAAAVLTLVRQRRLALDRPLAEYLPGPYRHRQDPFGPGPTDIVTDPRFRRITARMVLSHTSGLPNWAHRGPLTLLHDPGDRWSYSGEGYVYLQSVVESITREPLQTFVRQAVFVPLHMDHSSFVWEPRFAGHDMSPHRADGTAEQPAHYARALASSTLYTTLGDYAKFVEALLHPRPGSPFAREEAQQVVVVRALSLGWGLGVAVETAPHRAYFHWGANPGFQSFFLVQPGTARGVLFFTDSDNGLDLLDTVVARFVPGSHPVLRFPLLHPKD